MSLHPGVPVGLTRHSSLPRRARRGIIVAVLASWSCVVTAHATTYYVRTSGNDSNAGTSAAAAWRNIDKAANTMVAGDVCYVGAGTYNESVTPNNDGTSSNPIRYIADTTGAWTGDAGTVTISRNGHDPLDIDGDNYQHFIGFRLQTNKYGAKWNNSTGGVMQNCEVFASKDGGVHVVGGSLTIRECQIYDSESHGVYAENTWLVLLNTLIYNNNAKGVYTKDISAGAIVHCTIDDSNGDGVLHDGGTLGVYNTIITNSNGAGLNRSAGTLNHSYCCLFANSGGNYSGTAAGTGEMTANPQYVGGTNYRLATSSPAMNAGTDASAVTTIDLSGAARPQGAGWDMGCYETGGFLFTDVSTSSGFNVQTAGTADASGLHWGDLDSDGDLDAIITGGQARRLLNAGGATFTSSVFGGGSVMRQGALADLDNDGDLDFWAVNVGGYDLERLFANNGSAAFSNMGDAGFSAPTNNEGCAVADINWDGWCDVVMFSESGNYVGIHQGSGSVNFIASNAVVYGLNDSGDYGNGDFCSSGDINNDGRTDFFYHYNGGRVLLSEGDDTFRDATASISVTTGDADKFGSAWGDYDNDGDLDLFVPRYDSGFACYLWRNDNGAFTNVAAAAGITSAASHRAGCWGDYDNDGDLDLYVTTAAGGNLLYRNNGGGTFTAVNEGVSAAGNNHDAVFVDYDNDGDLDLAVTRQSTTNVLLRNGTNNTNYLKVRVIGHGAGATNKAGIGTRVELYNAAGTTLLARRDIGMARGFGGSEPLWLHFGGLNQNTTYTLKVHFISGTQTVSVTPAAASTTIGATTIQRMLTVVEQPTQESEIIRWVEVDPLQP